MEDGQVLSLDSIEIKDGITKTSKTTESDTEKTSFFQKMKESTAASVIFTAFSTIVYIQDIFQDILVFTSSIASNQEYDVLMDIKISERSFGYAMSGKVYAVNALDTGL